MVEAGVRPGDAGEFAFLQERRERLGLSVDDVAGAIGMNRWLYAAREANPLRLSLDDVIRLGDVLGFGLIDFACAIDDHLDTMGRS